MNNSRINKRINKRTLAPVEFHLSYGVREGGFLVEPGEIIETWIPDAHGYNAKNEQVAGAPNPLVGPFLINGAKPGDMLAVTIHQLEPNRENGFACKDIHPYVHHPPLPLSARRKEYVTWQIDTRNRSVIPDQRFFKDEKIMLPMRPVLGCIGVAPGLVEHADSKDCGVFGGNMDYTRIAIGATIYLPVFTENAYLYLGDGHALQGDGEITGNGIEVSFDIQFSVRINRLEIGCIAGEDSDYLFTVFNDRPLEKCLNIATGEMHKWLTSQHGLDSHQAGILLGQMTRFEVGNIVSNAYCGACCFPKNALPPIWK